MAPARGDRRRGAPEPVGWLARPRVGAGLIFLAACVVYANSLGGEFVFDDTSIVLNNPQIRGLGFANLKQIFGSHYWQTAAGQGGLYRPVVILSYAVNYALGGLEPAGYHCVNVLLHAANASLVFLLIEELFRNRLFAFWSGLLFALHPIRSEAVAYVVGRSEALAAFFFFLAWWLYLKRRLAPAAGAFLLAVWSKESAFTLLAVLPLSDFASRRGWGREALWRYAPFAAAVVAAIGVRYAVLGGAAPLQISHAANPLAAAALGPRLLTAAAVFGRYLWLLVFPVPLSADYSFNQIPVLASLWTAAFLISAVALVSLIVGAAWAARRSPPLFFCGVFFFATFSLTSNFIRPIGTIMAERLLYLPSLGFTCAIAYALAHARRRDVAQAAGALLALLYAGRTVARNADWRDHLAVFSSAAVVSPDSALVRANLAHALLSRRRDAAGAAEHAREAIRIEPGDPAAYMTLAQAYEMLGDLRRATQAYEQVERLVPGTAGAIEAARRREGIGGRF